MKWYKLVFKQEQPIYLGKSKYGVLSQTNLFINGYTMWGALTNIYIIKKKIDKDKIKSVGNKLKTITCFFPAFKEGNKYIVLYPQYENGLLYFKSQDNKIKYREDEFRLRFLDSFVSTSIKSSIRSAKDETLHITEFICPKDKNSGKQLYWVGLLGLKNDIDIKNVFSEIFIGGDTRYGFGNMKLVEPFTIEIDSDELNNWGINIDGTMKINNAKHDVLKNYLQLKDENNIRIKGEYGLIYQHSIYIEDRKALFCVYPGSKILDKIDSNFNKMTLVKGKFIFNN